MVNDVNIISHVSLDIYLDNLYLGGPVSYGGRMLRELTDDFLVIGMIGQHDFPFEGYYRDHIKKYQFILGNSTTTFSMDTSSGVRRIDVLRRGDDFSIYKLPEAALSAKYILISPIVDDMSLRFIEDISRTVKGTLCIDPYNNDDGKFTDEQRLYFAGITRYTPIIKMSKTELSGLFGVDRLEEGIKHLEEFSNLFLITLGEEGVCIYQRNNINEIVPSCKTSPFVDATGCGDIFFSSFLYALSQNFSLRRSTLFGNVCAGFSVRSKGVNSVPLKEEVFRTFERMKVSVHY